MTILFLNRLFYPHIGGVEKHVMELGKMLITKGHKVIVITEELPGNISNTNSSLINGIQVYRIPTGTQNRSKKFRIWFWLFKNRRLIKESNVIHCHDVFFWYLPFRFIYPSKPVFTTFHGYESYPISRKAIIVRKISEKLSFGNICIGDFIKKWYGTRPNFVSYGAVSIPNVSSRNSYILNPKSYIHSALFIGRLDEQTGVLTYNDAFKKLRRKYPKFEFLIVGDGPDKNLIDKQAKVIGFQKKPEKYFQNYRFAFVSRYLSILEAMAAKRLVFAVYDNPVKEDYLKMAPFARFIIIENDTKKLAKKVEYFISHPDKEKKLISGSFKWVKKQSWDALLELYSSLWCKSL